MDGQHHGVIKREKAKAEIVTKHSNRKHPTIMDFPRFTPLSTSGYCLNVITTTFCLQQPPSKLPHVQTPLPLPTHCTATKGLIGESFSYLAMISCKPLKLFNKPTAKNWLQFATSALQY